MIIEGSSVAECWLKCLQQMVKAKVNEISPAVIKINISEALPSYHFDLVNELDVFLKKVGQPSIETTANTIFPKNLSRGCASVYERFDKIWKYVKRDPKNHNGHYFRRFMAYGEKSGGESINQLKHIVETYNGVEGIRKPVHRRSALIAMTFDPLLDHTAQPQRGFPCLQQVCFVPHPDRSMSVNAIYAMQYLADRAFGNYIGLIELGQFMAKQMKLELKELQCIASVLALGTKMNKSTAKCILEKYGDYV